MNKEQKQVVVVSPSEPVFPFSLKQAVCLVGWKVVLNPMPMPLLTKKIRKLLNNNALSNQLAWSIDNYPSGFLRLFVRSQSIFWPLAALCFFLNGNIINVSEVVFFNFATTAATVMLSYMFQLSRIAEDCPMPIMQRRISTGLPALDGLLSMNTFELVSRLRKSGIPDDDMVKLNNLANGLERIKNSEHALMHCVSVAPSTELDDFLKRLSIAAGLIEQDDIVPPVTAAEQQARLPSPSLFDTLEHAGIAVDKEAHIEMPVFVEFGKPACKQ